MVIIGKRMIPSLKGILKSTGKTMLGIIKQARYYDDPSLPSFDPSRMRLSMNGVLPLTPLG